MRNRSKSSRRRAIGSCATCTSDFLRSGRSETTLSAKYKQKKRRRGRNVPAALSLLMIYGREVRARLSRFGLPDVTR